jgi:hypothetical protein
MDAPVAHIPMTWPWWMTERLSRPFGRDLLKHQPVEQAMDQAPLVVDEGISLDDLSSALIDDATKYIFDGSS